MLKKDITYTDFDDNKCTDTFYFNLTKTEVVELEVSEKGGYGAFLQKIVDEQDNKMILRYIKDLVSRAYGEKSEDGKRFIKSPELSEAFLQTMAFDELVMEFFENPAYMAEFMTGLVPKELGDKLEAAYAAEFAKPGAPKDFQKPKSKVALKDLQAGKS